MSKKKVFCSICGNTEADCSYKGEPVCRDCECTIGQDFETSRSGSLCDAETFIDTYLEGDDYGRGSVEAARTQADNASKALARLIGILYKDELLTKENVNFIGKGY